jgi:hypothetical protein
LKGRNLNIVKRYFRTRRNAESESSMKKFGLVYFETPFLIPISHEAKMELKVEESYMWIIMDRYSSLIVGKFDYSCVRRCGLVGSKDIIKDRR